MAGTVHGPSYGLFGPLIENASNPQRPIHYFCCPAPLGSAFAPFPAPSTMKHTLLLRQACVANGKEIAEVSSVQARFAFCTGYHSSETRRVGVDGRLGVHGHSCSGLLQQGEPRAPRLQLLTYGAAASVARLQVWG